MFLLIENLEILFGKTTKQYFQSMPCRKLFNCYNKYNQKLNESNKGLEEHKSLLKLVEIVL